MTIDQDNARLLGDFAKKLQDKSKYREVHIYYSPIDYYIIRPELVQAVEVREYTSQQVLHIENSSWDLDLPTSLIGTVVWHKNSENPEQHPLTRALNNINFKKITITLTNQNALEIPAEDITNVEETGRSVNIYFRNGDLIDVDLRYVVSMKCEQRVGKFSEIYSLALQKSDAKDWSGASELLKQLTENDSTDYEAFYRLGYAQLQNKKPEDALKAAKLSTTLYPYNPRSWLLQCKAYQDLNRMEEAKSLLVEAIGKFPKDAPLWMELSNVYTRLENYEEAIRCQNVVLEMEPDNYEEWEYLGDIADLKKDLSLAITAFEKVIALAPLDSEIYKKSLERLGCRYCHKGDLVSATSVFNILIDKFPKNAKGWDLMSCISRKNNDYEQAEKSSRLAIELDPTNSNYWASLGYVLYKSDLKEAESSCRKALKIDSEDSYNWTALAKVLFAKNELKEAIKAVNRAEELDPNNSKNLYNIADGFATVKDAKKVLEYLQKALQLDNTHVGMLKDDREFTFLRENKEFIKLQEEYKK